MKKKKKRAIIKMRSQKPTESSAYADAQIRRAKETMELVCGKSVRTPEEEKAEKILSRIAIGLDEELRNNLVANDAMFIRLSNEKVKADEENRIFASSNLTRLAEARATQILREYIQKDLGAMVESGYIMNFLDEEDKERLESIRGALCLLMDATDTVLCDMDGMLRSVGLEGGFVMPSIKKARQDIEAFLSKGMSLQKLEGADVIYHDETDKLYEHCKERYRVMKGKLKVQVNKVKKQLTKKD